MTQRRERTLNIPLQPEELEEQGDEELGGTPAYEEGTGGCSTQGARIASPLSVFSALLLGGLWGRRRD